MTKMTPKFQRIFDDCLENGIRRGYARAHKHVENPGEEIILDNIQECIMSELYEYFNFKEEDD
jgi:hypothetical protein